jgi:hypothetical protein
MEKKEDLIIRVSFKRKPNFKKILSVVYARAEDLDRIMDGRIIFLGVVAAVYNCRFLVATMSAVDWFPIRQA